MLPCFVNIRLQISWNKVSRVILTFAGKVRGQKYHCKSNRPVYVGVRQGLLPIKTSVYMATLVGARMGRCDLLYTALTGTPDPFEP